MSRIAVVVAVALAACGPSTKQVQTAKATHYKTQAGRIYSIALDVAEKTFKIYDKDDDKEIFVTLPKWYTADGQSETSGSGDTVMVSDGSLEVALMVAVETDVDGIATVTVTPVVERFRLGQSQHDKLAPDDPSMPGWVGGKADALAVEIYNAAKPYAAP
jgi:hypothetical protein